MSAPEQADLARRGTEEKRTVAIGSAVGTTIENYDFTAFTTAAAIYFGHEFFPAGDSSAGTLASFATLGVGFLARPLGGLIGGHVGDRVGRRPVLLGALLVMGVATVLIGLLPTYEQVGVWAPILLVTCRVLQGLAFGAEWGGAVLLTYENAPWRRRGAYTAIPQVGIPLGLLLANVVFLASAGLDSDLAWRIPFLASAVLVVAGLILRTRVHESPDFTRLAATDHLERAPLLVVVRDSWREILQIFGMRMGQAGAFYIVVSYFTSYLTTAHPTADPPTAALASKSTALTGVVVAAALGVVVTLLYGRLSDTVGRRPLYLAGTAAMVLTAVPCFLLLNTGSAVAIVVAYVLGLTVSHDLQSSVQGAYFSELFATGTRTSGASIGYQVSAALAGFVPFIAAAAALGLGWPGVAGFTILMGLIGFVAALSTRDTWGAAQRAEVDALIAEAATPRSVPS